MGPIVFHTVTIILGAVVAVVTLNIPCRYFKLMTPFLLIITVVLLLWVLATGERTGDASRWINIFGLTFQPSEIAKGTVVLATAQILSAMQLEDDSGADPKAMKYILWLALPMIMLIGLENLSTAMLLFAVIFAMMFIGRVPLKQLGKVVGVVVLMGALAFGIGTLAGDDAAKTDATEQTTANVQHKEEGFVAKIFHRFGTWRNRLVNHQPRPENPKDYKVRENFQVAHSNFAIASSGIFGKGPGNSVERDYLPQAFSDFIFSIIIEEMGLIGAIAVVFLYIILLFRSARISGRCENNFPAFLVMGLALLLVTQAAINMMVAVGIGPVTGQPLPLVSKGGTSTLVSCAYIGAILSVSRSAKRNDLAKETANA